MPTKIELLEEAEKRGLLPEDKKGLLQEARSRGLIVTQPSQAAQAPSDQKVALGGLGTPSTGPLGATLRSFADSATAGLIEPAATGVSMLADKAMQAGGLLPKESLPNLAAQFLQNQKAQKESLKSSYPFSSGVGEALGYVTPLGAFGKTMELGEAALKKAAPYAEKYGGRLIENAPELVQKAGRLFGRVASSGAEGAIGNEAYESLNPNRQSTHGEALGVGAVSNIIPHTIGEGIDYARSPAAKETAKNTIESIPFLGKFLKSQEASRIKPLEEAFAAKEAGKSLAKEQAKMNYASDVEAANNEYLQQQESKKNLIQKFNEKQELRRSQYDEAKKNAVDKLKNLDPGNVESAQAFGDSVKQLKDTMSKEYSEVVGPIEKRISLKKAHVDNVRKSIVSEFETKGYLKQNGQIDYKAINSITDPSIRNHYLQLADYSRRLSKNPSVQSLKNIMDEFSNKANWKNIYSTADESTFRKLWHDAKESMFDSLEKNAGGDNLKKIRDARARYKEGKDILNQIGGLSSESKYAEEIAKGLQSKLPGRFIEETLASRPELKPEMANAILSDITNKATSPKQLTKLMDYYGRDNLKNLLGKRFDDLVKAEKSLYSTSKPFVKEKFPKIDLKKRKVSKPDLSEFAPSKFIAPESEVEKSIGWLQGMIPKNKPFMKGLLRAGIKTELNQ